MLGKNACSSGYDFEVHIHYGAGAYRCGEETAFLENLERKDLERKNNLKTKLSCVSGYVNKPYTVDGETSILQKELIKRHCRGVRGGWNNILAVISGDDPLDVVGLLITEPIINEISEDDVNGLSDQIRQSTKELIEAKCDLYSSVGSKSGSFKRWNACNSLET
ncbi:NADH dehydrogenase [ubiquinone] flavoprotein 1, mitochondrial-like [Durio zibethinus]|uniref:NADH dehydrogenase [ubiquinone] flavoprotein 1, mitochondrial-like n=1 Tax=Durio zibethinus TaxID=66656 RepID=A0A6P5YUD8_DURZI|nr:NADH dehydrogenase [ubiquinone] flavoprotein 1, mitochondrial-like [Durio zibethinus]